MDKPLDTMNDVFYSVELTLSFIFVPFSLGLAWILYMGQLTHPNFRFILQVFNFGNFLTNGYRIWIVAWTLTHGHREPPLGAKFWINFMYFGNWIVLYSFLMLIVERALASRDPANYDKTFGKTIYRFHYGAIIFAMVSLLLLIRNSIDPHIFDIGQVYLEILFSTIILIFLLFINCYNRRLYDVRHQESLSHRFQVKENLATTSYIIPVAVLKLINGIQLACLFSYSVFFTNIVIGEDTSHLSHAYDVPFAIFRVIDVVWLFWKGNQERCRKIKTHPRDRAEGNVYFHQLNQQWQ